MAQPAPIFYLHLHFIVTIIRPQTERHKHLAKKSKPPLCYFQSQKVSQGKYLAMMTRRALRLTRWNLLPGDTVWTGNHQPQIYGGGPHSVILSQCDEIEVGTFIGIGWSGVCPCYCQLVCVGASSTRWSSRWLHFSVFGGSLSKNNWKSCCARKCSN